MSSQRFLVHRVDRSQSEAAEQLGSKPKFWFREGDRRLLFKGEARGYGEDWAEVVASHLCDLVGIPHVQYELAECVAEGRLLWPGVLCENMVRAPSWLVLGNQLLLALDARYPEKQQFKVRQHSVDSVANAVSAIQAPQPVWATHLPANVRTAADVFVGYLMLDAWVANQDRHHENWGAIVTLMEDGHELELSLAPTFDHAAGMARNLSDLDRQKRLSTQNEAHGIQAFARRARSRLYRSEADERPLTTLDAFTAFAQRAPVAADAWLDRLSAVSDPQVSAILERVPPTRMLPVTREFTLALLAENRRRLLETRNT